MPLKRSPFAARAPADDRLVLGKLVGADEGELLEQRMSRRQAAEDLRHRLGDLRAHGGEVVGQALGLQRLAEAGVLGEARARSAPREVGTPNRRFSATVA